MDAARFSENSPGRLVQISTSFGPDWAFVPHPLPPQWEFPASLWPLLAKAREEIARLDGIGRHVPNPQLLLRPLQRWEALRSSSLEGTFATPRELLLFELEPKDPQSARDPANAWREVWNHGQALQGALDLLKTLPISNRLIREMHRVLLSGVRGEDKRPGEFRNGQVHIGATRRFVPPPHLEAKECLYSLEKYIHVDSPYDPLIDCFLVHYQFETIHPFHDGNGRIGRLLLSLMIYERCGLSHPWMYLSAFFDRYKDDYINALFNVSAKGDWESWVRLCLQATISQADDSIRRIDQLVALQKTWIDAVCGSTRLIQLISYLFDNPILTVTRAAEIGEVVYATGRADIKKLVRAGILEPMADTYPKKFVAMAIIRIAYS